MPARCGARARTHLVSASPTGHSEACGQVMPGEHCRYFTSLSLASLTVTTGGVALCFLGRWGHDSPAQGHAQSPPFIGRPEWVRAGRGHNWDRIYLNQIILDHFIFSPKTKLCSMNSLFSSKWFVRTFGLLIFQRH